MFPWYSHTEYRIKQVLAGALGNSEPLYDIKIIS